MSDARILVVDDHRDMADGIAMLLGELSLDVRVAYSARDALSRLEQDEFQLVLSDIKMPAMENPAGGVTGRAAAPPSSTGNKAAIGNYPVRRARGRMV